MYLSLLLIISCVFGTVYLQIFENFALGKKAYQSDGTTAGRAVDGNTSQILVNYAGSCTYTTGASGAFWEVDLGRRYFIHHVTIYNRKDCCGDRLRDVELYIGKETDNYRKHGFHEGVVGSIYTFQLNQSVVGQWVRITRSSSVEDILTLCEAQVFGPNAGHYYRIHKDMAGLETSIQTSMVAKTDQHCAYICYTMDGCEASSYREETQMCDLLTSDASEESVGGNMLIPYE